MKNIFIIFSTKYLISLTIFVFLIFSQSHAHTTGKIYHSNPIIGLVDGKPITFEDVRNKKAHELSVQLYQQLNIQFMGYALQNLATKYPEIKLNPENVVNNKDILAFFEVNNLQERGTLEQLQPQIKQYLENQIRQQHLLKQYELALKKGWIVSHLETPSDFMLKGNIKTGYIRGNKKAPVIIVEFSDYQCPFCSRIQSTINKLLENFQERVAFGYRHFPLSFHQEADEAAISSECAREQGKFEEMHKLLYLNQKNQSRDDLKKYAREIKVKSPKKFDQCLDSERYRGLVNQDIKDGSEMGITGTPGFFLGLFDHNSGEIVGEILSGALPYSSFKKNLEKYLNYKQ